MIPYRKPPENIIIDTKIVKGNVVYVWNNRPFISEYLARKAASLAAKAIEKSIPKTCV